MTAAHLHKHVATDFMVVRCVGQLAACQAGVAAQCSKLGEV
jgi:hypothetical protein